jgi:hypothetical protein
MAARKHCRTRVGSVILVAAAFIASGCISERATVVHVKGGNPPVFTFSNAERMDLLLVFRLHDINSGVPLEHFKPNNPDTMWWIEGERRKDEPIAYGAVPIDMREITPAKPLVEGDFYMVHGNSAAGGAFLGATFVIRDGQAQKIK